jgi:hypothetical protein
VNALATDAASLYVSVVRKLVGTDAVSHRAAKSAENQPDGLMG